MYMPVDIWVSLESYSLPVSVPQCFRSDGRTTAVSYTHLVQSVILDMVRYENYKTEFIATAMLSAVSAALGGTYLSLIHILR